MKRKRYTVEFKQQVVREVLRSGNAAKSHVAMTLIHHSSTVG